MSSGSSSSGLGFGEKEKEKAHLVFAGFAAMLDPPRKSIADAMALLQSGGVQVVMITGDAEETTLLVARSLGLRGATGDGSVSDGRRSGLHDRSAAVRARGQCERVCAHEPEAQDSDRGCVPGSRCRRGDDRRRR